MSKPGATQLISEKIAELSDWRGKTLARMRKLIQGASLKDPKRLFNSSLEGKVRRAIDIREGEEVNASAFKALVREAIAHNAS